MIVPSSPTPPVFNPLHAPPGATLRIESTQHADATLIVALDGEIRFDSAEVLPAWIEALRRGKPVAQVCLDFHRVRFVDSQGLAVLYNLFRTLKAQQIGLRVRGASAHIASLIEMTRLSDFIALES